LQILTSMSNEVEKTKYSDEELQEFKVIINQKLEKARKQMNFYLQQMAEMANNSDSKIKGLDDGNSTTEAERLSTMAARQRKHTQHLENALIRIDNKVFGICRATGKLISKERLKAVPHATLSINAKQRKK